MILFAATAEQVLKGIVIAKEHIVAFAVDSAGSGLHHEFAVAVTVEVPCDKLHGVGAGKEVGACIDTPQQCAVHFDTVEIDRRCSARAGSVFFVRGRPFEYDFVLAVAVHVAVACVVGGVACATSRSRGLQRYAVCLVSPGLTAYFAVDEFAGLVVGFETVEMVNSTGFVLVVGAVDDVEVFVEHFGLGSFVATVKFVLHAVAVGFAMTPRHEVACTHFRTGKAERHQAAVKGLGRPLGCMLVTLKRTLKVITLRSPFIRFTCTARPS